MWLGKDKIIQLEIPGCKNQKHRILHSNHFIQEDKTEELTNIILEFISDNYI